MRHAAIGHQGLMPPLPLLCAWMKPSQSRIGGGQSQTPAYWHDSFRKPAKTSFHKQAEQTSTRPPLSSSNRSRLTLTQPARLSFLHRPFASAIHANVPPSEFLHVMHANEDTAWHDKGALRGKHSLSEARERSAL